MFAIFQNGIFYSFWQNKKKDNWARATVKKLNLQEPEIYWYNKGDYNAPDNFRFDDNKNLIVTVVTGYDNETGNPIMTDTDEVYKAEAYKF